MTSRDIVMSVLCSERAAAQLFRHARALHAMEGWVQVPACAGASQAAANARTCLEERCAAFLAGGRHAGATVRGAVEVLLHLAPIVAAVFRLEVAAVTLQSSRANAVLRRSARRALLSMSWGRHSARTTIRHEKRELCGDWASWQRHSLALSALTVSPRARRTCSSAYGISPIGSRR